MLTLGSPTARERASGAMMAGTESASTRHPALPSRCRPSTRARPSGVGTRNRVLNVSTMGSQKISGFQGDCSGARFSLHPLCTPCGVREAPDPPEELTTSPGGPVFLSRTTVKAKDVRAQCPELTNPVRLVEEDEAAK